MTFRNGLRRFVLALAAGAASVSTAHADGSAFPSLSGRTLLGESETLPRDLGGRPALVFVAFERAQQDQVVSWLPFVQRLGAREPRVPVVQIPVLPRYAKTFGTFIEGRFRSAIAGDEARHATLLVYDDPAAVAHALGLENGRDAAIVVVDARGEIAWLGHGTYDANAAGDASRALDALAP